MARQSKHADILLYNGNFITLDSVKPYASSLAIKDEKIAWIGNEDISNNPWAGPNTELINLEQAFAYPGFIDTHAHILYTGMHKSYLQLSDNLYKAAILDLVKKHLKHCRKDEWIIGAGWDNHHWPKESLPHAKDLDIITLNHPVVLQRCDTHLIWVNSLALKLAGIDRHTPDPLGGIIEKDSSGNPTGILVDSAMLAIKKVIPIPSLQERIKITTHVLDECLQKGITMIHNAATDSMDFDVFLHLASENTLKMRIYLMAAVRDPYGGLFKEGSSPITFSPLLEMRCLKIWSDGALGSRGAALLTPYHDDDNNIGLLLWEESALIFVLKKAKAHGFQVAAHAIGDRANRFILDLFEKVGVKGLRWRIEHAELIAKEDVSRFAKLGVIAAIQPVQATSDMVWLEKSIGEKRVKETAFIWQSLLKAGTLLVGGSDSPVGDFNPLWGIYAAITRQDHHQYPEGGWYPGQRLTREEALKIYTCHAAYACFQENQLGTLQEGKCADLVVLPKNILTCPPSDLLNMKVLLTIVNGKIVFRA